MTEANPNGSVENIAGVVNQDGTVLGLMPHPERAAESAMGGTDGPLSSTRSSAASSRMAVPQTVGHASASRRGRRGAAVIAG